MACLSLSPPSLNKQVYMHACRTAGAAVEHICATRGHEYIYLVGYVYEDYSVLFAHYPGFVVARVYAEDRFEVSFGSRHQYLLSLIHI
jgi:hypothetical protein